MSDLIITEVATHEILLDAAMALVNERKESLKDIARDILK